MRTLKLLLCCGILGLATTAAAKPTPVDSVAAVVNDAIITKSELARQMKMMEQQLQRSGNSTPDRQSLEKQVLEQLILNEIQLQMAKKTGILVDDTMLDHAIENIAQQNGMNVSQLREAVTQEGIDFNLYRNNIRQQIAISQLQQRDVMHTVQVSDQEATQFLQSPNGLGAMATEYRLGHILIALPEAPSPEELDLATQKAQRIIADLRHGKDFSQAAMAESIGEHALKGGDLGWRKLPELPTIFVKTVPTLKLNEIPEPIRSASGLHIIRLLDKRNAAQTQADVGKSMVRHILIKTNTNSSDTEAKQRLIDLTQKIAAGEDFAQLAKAHSADLGSASNGGSLGWITKDVVVPEFGKVMEQLEINEISEPFKTPFGWHIVQVLERKTISNEDVSLRQKAKEMIQQRKYEEKLQAWSRQLRDEAYVKIASES